MAALGSSGVLLVNLGTPDAPTTAAVRRYLAEFLADPHVLDMNPAARWLLLHALILPFRSPKSARAYASVWRADGSPLLVHSRALVEAVATRLSPTPVALAMRYGQPSIADGLQRLHAAGCRRLVVAPLYPQFATSSTTTATAAVEANLRGRWGRDDVAFVPPFYDHPAFIAAWAAVAAPVLDEFRPDHVLFSFHGLPERHVRAVSDPSICLASPACCDAIGPGNARCYRAQCHATWRGLVAALALDGACTSIAFQSRLGREPWIRPYTDVALDELARAGVRRLAVVCPAFVADCLETVEEIGLRARAQFRAAGGEELRLVPSLNATPAWVDAVIALIEEAKRTPPAPT
jgi:ferrochelatase